MIISISGHWDGKIYEMLEINRPLVAELTLKVEAINTMNNTEDRVHDAQSFCRLPNAANFARRVRVRTMEKGRRRISALAFI
jgi:hypothetical protein